MVTAVADATANPRTEIRLTWCPSRLARLGDLAGAIVPLTLASLLLGSREARARWATPLRERRVVLAGGIRTASVELCGAVRLWRCTSAVCGA
ncbi:hypothetical protein Sfulv_39100 [Streptomyces fulvorobeus]|uniref:Uncharacterized protein n=1 Tax=Streptomyces fulvorobeus TaxID=284028 RepID=A0A7J0C9C7_9ACTN|nr:hypothetical protein Sfulv_39100 [Streptomyces fulvorobeus]